MAHIMDIDVGKSDILVAAIGEALFELNALKPHGIPPPPFFVAYLSFVVRQIVPRAHGLPYILRCTYINYTCWESSPCSKIGPAPLDPARSLARYRTADQRGEQVVVVTSICLQFIECRYSTSEVLKKYKPTARSSATRSARSPPS